MTKPQSAPSFPLYVDNFVEGSCDMSQPEAGAYIRLLCHQWTRGRIPKDGAKLERVAGGKVSRDVLRKFPHGRNKRLEKERRKMIEFRAKRSAAGTKGAEKKWHSHPSTDGKTDGTGHGKAMAEPMAKGMAKNSLPSSFPLSLSPTNKIKPTKLPPSFNEGQKNLTALFDVCLGEQWVNDRQKWMGRIKNHFAKAERVLAEVENAAKEGRIKTTPAQYAEQIWKEFN